jgi:hypothetical protein
VNYAKIAQTKSVGFFEVGFDGIFDVARRDRMQIEDVGNGNSDWFLVHKSPKLSDHASQLRAHPSIFNTLQRNRELSPPRQW